MWHLPPEYRPQAAFNLSSKSEEEKKTDSDTNSTFIDLWNEAIRLEKELYEIAKRKEKD